MMNWIPCCPIRSKKLHTRARNVVCLRLLPIRRFLLPNSSSIALEARRALQSQEIVDMRTVASVEIFEAAATLQDEGLSLHNLGQLLLQGPAFTGENQRWSPSGICYASDIVGGPVREKVACFQTQ